MPESLSGLNEGERFTPIGTIGGHISATEREPAPTPTGQIKPAEPDPDNSTTRRVLFPAGVTAFPFAGARPILLPGVGFLTVDEARQAVAALLGALAFVEGARYE